MSTRTKKTVTIADNNATRIYEKTIAEHITDVEIATDAIVSFLERTVEDVMTTVGKHHRTRDRKSPQSPVNMNFVQYKVFGALQQLIHPHKPSTKSKNDILQYFNSRMHWKVRDIFLEAVKTNDNITRYAATVLIVVGLESFIAFNHCMNECYKALEYHDTEDVIRVKPYGKQHSKLKDVCLDSHERIQKALNMDDIRQFDTFLRRASNNKCSMIKEQHIPVRKFHKGGNAIIHTGPRGGKYTLVNGKKVYV